MLGDYHQEFMNSCYHTMCMPLADNSTTCMHNHAEG